MCVLSGSSMEAETQPARWTAPPPDVMSSLLFMHLFLSSAELSEPDAPLLPPPWSSIQYSRPTLQLPPANEGGHVQLGFIKGHERKQKQAE